MCAEIVEIFFVTTSLFMTLLALHIQNRTIQSRTKQELTVIKDRSISR